MPKILKSGFRYTVEKILIAIIVVCIILMLCVVGCVSDVLIPKRAHIDITNYQESIDYGILSTSQIQTFNDILYAGKNKQSVISCPEYSTKERHEILTHLGMYFGTIENIEDLISWDNNVAYLNLSFFEELSANKIIIDSRIDEAVSTLKEGSDKYKLWQISNYIARRMVYIDEYRDTVSALNGKGVCVGYTMLFYKMATRIGIKTFTCYGYIKNGYHTWNMVELDGKYIYYDITFYDGDPYYFGYIHSKYSPVENFQVNNKWNSDLPKENNGVKIGLRRLIMTVRELKEKLEQFPENCVVLIPNENLYRDKSPFWYVHAKHVGRGVNEMDGCVIIDDYVEED